MRSARSSSTTRRSTSNPADRFRIPASSRSNGFAGGRAGRHATGRGHRAVPHRDRPRGLAERGRQGHGGRRPRPCATPPAAITRRRICCTRRCARSSASHVRQAGSLVAPDRLRFDFTHSGAVTDDEKRELERVVNEQVYRNTTVETAERTTEEAIKDGAMALFGEKYGDTRAGRLDSRLQHGALRRHPRPGHGRHRPVRDYRGIKRRGRRPAYRGFDRRRRRRLRAAARRCPGRRRRRALGVPADQAADAVRNCRPRRSGSRARTSS